MNEDRFDMNDRDAFFDAVAQAEATSDVFTISRDGKSVAVLVGYDEWLDMSEMLDSFPLAGEETKP